MKEHENIKLLYVVMFVLGLIVSLVEARNCHIANLKNLSDVYFPLTIAVGITGLVGLWNLNRLKRKSIAEE